MVGKPYKMPQIEYITTLIEREILPTLKSLFLILIANPIMSLPPPVPPEDKISPLPIPAQIAPIKTDVKISGTIATFRTGIMVKKKV